MADVLSQGQIDRLLKSMHGGEAEQKTEVAEHGTETDVSKYHRYDFYSPRKFTKDKMKILTSVFENYARIITSQVNGIFRVMTDITVLEVQECRYYEFVNSLKDNDSITLVDVHSPDKGNSKVPLMIYATPGLVITLISHMLGGGDEVVQVEPEYRYSDVELALYRRVAEYFCQALKDGFSNYINMDFEVQRVEENPTMVQEVGLDETVAIIILNVDVAGVAVEKIKLCIPGTLLEFIFAMIDSKTHIARGFLYEDNQETIMENIRYSQMRVTGQLAKVELNLSDLYHLQVGDVIDLNKPKDGGVKLFVGRQPWFTGTMGIYKKNMAVRISDRIYAAPGEGETPRELSPTEGAQ